MKLNGTNPIIVAVLFVILSISANAQRGGNTAWTKYRHEVSVGYGVNSLFGRLGESDKINMNYVLQRSTFNASYRYYFLKHFAARGSISHGFARKNDKSDNIETRQNVRLDYQATMTEFAAMAEWHLLDEATKGRQTKIRRSRGGVSKGANVGVSFFAGVGLNYLRPFGEYYGDEVELRPITDPLQVPNNDRYKKLNLTFPVGTNVRMVVAENWRVGFEFGYRLGLREYINNVSGVYYRDPELINSDPYTPDPQYIGVVTFEKEQAPIQSLVNEKGKRNYFFGFLTLSYRIKS